ncbi:MAG: hypothetical protein OIF58_05645, partial [Cohaesibacter sp.]|nr:hypothetical protein [Cohaesibacter sp.]
TGLVLTGLVLTGLVLTGFFLIQICSSNLSFVFNHIQNAFLLVSFETLPFEPVSFSFFLVWT